MKKKFLSIVLTFVMVVSLIPAVAMAEEEAKTIYVDANSTTEETDGTEACPYKTIQSAVNAASDGDTILVKAGNYNVWCPKTSSDNYSDNYTERDHNLFIGKNITIKGEGEVNLYSLQNEYSYAFDKFITVLISGSKGVVLNNLNIYPCYYSTEVSGLPTVTESKINQITNKDTLYVYYNQIIDTLTNYDNGKETSEKTIENLTIKNCTIGDKDLDADEWGSAIYLNGYVNNVATGISGGYLIENNELYGSICICEDGGWNANTLSQNCIIRNNTLYDTIILNGNRPTGWNYKSLTVKPTITGNTFNAANWTLEDDGVEYNYCVGARDAADEKVFTQDELETIITNNNFAGDLEGKNIGVAIGRHSYDKTDDEAYSVIHAFSPVASITRGDSTTEYSSLKEAISAAQDGDTVNIIADCTIAPVEIGSGEWKEGITIEGNGHTVTGWDETEYDIDHYGLAIDVYSKVAFNNIKFTDFACEEASTNIDAAVINGCSGCDITITNCTFEKFNRQAIFFAPSRGGDMTVEKCTFDCTPVKKAFTVQKAFMIEPGTKESEVSIKNSTITCAKSTAEGWTSGGIEIFGGTVVVEGCTLTNCDEGVVVSREYFNNDLDRTDYDVSSSVKLKNNTISANNRAVYITCYKGGETTANVSIESGKHKGKVGIVKSGFKEDGSDMAEDSDLKNCSMTLTGGYYSTEPAAAYVANGYYVDASNISGYPYVVTKGSKPADSTIVIVKDETTPSISSSISAENKTKIESVINKTEVQGVTEAVAANKDVLVKNSEINTGAAEVDKVNVDVDVKVKLTAADLSAANKTMTYTATPVATVTTKKSDGQTVATVSDIAVPNSLLSGALMTVRLPLPTGFELKQIIHKSTGYADEYILAEGNTQGLKSFKVVEEDEVTLAEFTVTHFSTFELSGEVTYVAPKSKRSSSSVSSYAIGVEKTTNGTVSADCSSAVKGSTVTLTVKPGEGYTLKKISALDGNGAEIKITDKGDGKYTFEMPASRVTVSAEFAKAGEQATDYASCPKDATCPINPFTDTQNTAWYHDGVHFCLDNKLMIGFSDDSFSPDRDVTRAQVVTILWRIKGQPVVNYAMPFSDIFDGLWYTEAVRWAASNGIVTGYDDAHFGANEAITREQFAAILWRYSKFCGYDVSVGEDTNILDYEDATSISSYAIPAIQWACGSSVISGVSELKLEPKGVTTRAQAACMIQRFLTENK